MTAGLLDRLNLPHRRHFPRLRNTCPDPLYWALVTPFPGQGIPAKILLLKFSLLLVLTEMLGKLAKTLLKERAVSSVAPKPI